MKKKHLKAGGSWGKYHRKIKKDRGKALRCFKLKLKTAELSATNPMYLPIKIAKNAINYQVRKIVAHITQSDNHRYHTKTGNLSRKQAPLKANLESKFLPDMCWENYGRSKGCWNIGYIISINTARTMTELKALKSNKNLIPKWGKNVQFDESTS